MLNGLPNDALDAAMRADRAREAREIVKAWTRTFQITKQACIKVAIQVSHSEAGGLLVGKVVELLEEEGLELVSHSEFPIGMNEAKEPIVICSLIVRTKDGKARSVILA